VARKRESPVQTKDEEKAWRKKKRPPKKSQKKVPKKKKTTKISDKRTQNITLCVMKAKGVKEA